MNIESQTINKPNKPNNQNNQNKVNDTISNSQAAINPNASAPDGKSFKSELKSIDSKEQKAEQMSTSINQNTTQSSTVTAPPAANKQGSSQSNDANSFKDELNSIEGSVVKSDADKTVSDKQVADAKVISGHPGLLNILNKANNSVLGQNEEGEPNMLEPLNELGSKIATIRELKSGSFKSQKSEKSEKDELDASLNPNIIKMDHNDALFFAQLVNGDKLTAQGSGLDSNQFTEIKSEATQSSSKVSATLMDSLNESMKTNKPFRIDFDKDIAVIMRVDRDGKLSAEFIPGDKAVEQYLKNNIPLLKESFDKQNLPYSELSYQKQKQQHQQNDNRKKNKEKDDE